MKWQIKRIHVYFYETAHDFVIKDLFKEKS